MNSNLNAANDYYKKSQQTAGLSRVLRQNYLEKAIAMYTKEINHATRDNYPSLLKNLGLANYRLVDVHDTEDDRVIIYHLAEALKAFSTAWVMKPEEQKTEWGGRLEELMSDCFEKAYRACKYYVTFAILVQFLLQFEKNDRMPKSLPVHYGPQFLKMCQNYLGQFHIKTKSSLKLCI